MDSIPCEGKPIFPNNNKALNMATNRDWYDPSRTIGSDDDDELIRSSSPSSSLLKTIFPAGRSMQRIEYSTILFFFFFLTAICSVSSSTVRQPLLLRSNSILLCSVPVLAPIILILIPNPFAPFPQSQKINQNHRSQIRFILVYNKCRVGCLFISTRTIVMNTSKSSN